ncbi:phosphotransferase family protein [Modestobacter sp. I12A-02662]|uniref:phosphotransferase family protein n=1 Tax=Modestobacter sp. I12A-02662 TaxID=1730496 RepID=UPI0034DE40C3
MSDRPARAVAAAVAVARAHGLRADDPVVLHDGVNLVTWLRPAPVVARVATLTPLLRPAIGRPFAREVELARALAATGAAVVAPSELLPPGPHEHDGLTLSFWEHVDVLPEAPTAAQAGRSLAELHAALAGIRPRWDGAALDTPFDDLAAFAAHGAQLGADPPLLREVPALACALRARVAGPDTTLHGDAHPGNLLATRAGLRWTDLEDTSRGPRAWDLACLRSTGRLDGRAALDAMPDPVSDEELAPFRWLRLLHAGAWWFVHAARVPEHLPEARTRLAAAVAEVSAGLR